MNKGKDFFKTCFNIVAKLDTKNENQVIAKEVVLSEVENLQQENKQLKDNWIELKNYLEKIIVDSKSCSTKQYYYEQVYKFVIELEQGSDSNE